MFLKGIYRRMLTFAIGLALLGCQGEPPQLSLGDNTPKDGPGGLPVILAPALDSEVLFSVPIKVQSSAETALVRITSENGGNCTAAAPYFECLLDLSGAPTGRIPLTITAIDVNGTEISQIAHSLIRRAIETPCQGNAAQLMACILARALAGTSAGFSGVAYINGDNGHARLNTTAMTGIDAYSLADLPADPPHGVEMGIANESRSWVPSGGYCSLPRCWVNTRRALALSFYEKGLFVFWPEHRDHGYRDYYQWQAPFFGLSQGSSGSELDEVEKLLRGLAVMNSAARLKAKQAAAIGPLVSFLLGRSRVSSDGAYLSQNSHPTTYANSTNEAALLTLAANLRANEIPPVAKMIIDQAVIPFEWGMSRTLTTPYAVGYSPWSDPVQTPAGRFEITVNLSDSVDPNGRELSFFPFLLRGSDQNVEIVRANAAGTTWIVRGNYPQDFTLNTVGKDRIISRTTVGFFPHNGVWLGSPIFLSVGGHLDEATAPDTNNLD